MQVSQFHYLPLTPPFFSILVAMFLIVLVLVWGDLLNLGNIRGLGAPVASIGGAGTFDGIFLIGIPAVLLASIPRSRDSAEIK